MGDLWKSDYPFVQRYEHIQTIQSSQGISLDEAMAIERLAFEESMSKDEYLLRCEPADDGPSPPSPPFSPLTPESPESAGIQIGPYKNCTLIADGVTSEVYRAKGKALKVIVTGNQDMTPHNPQREVQILESLRNHDYIIQLLGTFRDRESRLVMEFPHMPVTLADVLAKGEKLGPGSMQFIFRQILRGLDDIHSQGIIHRDIKPSAILLDSIDGSAVRLSDFGTAWHPHLSEYSEPPDSKILDVGTGPYRAPDCLFGNQAYTTSIDMWSFGVMLTEALAFPSKPIFESRPAHEDGSQLGLILSIFKTLGTATRETWPEAAEFKVTPFEMWTVFPPRPWEEILPGVAEEWLAFLSACFRYQGRVTAKKALGQKCFRGIVGYQDDG